MVTATGPWAQLGPEGTMRLGELLRPLARAVVGSGELPRGNPVGLLARGPDGSESAERIGPAPVSDDQWRLLVRAPLPDADQLVDALGGLRSVWTARKETEPLAIQVDP